MKHSSLLYEIERPDCLTNVPYRHGVGLKSRSRCVEAVPDLGLSCKVVDLIRAGFSYQVQSEESIGYISEVKNETAVGDTPHRLQHG